VIPVPRIKSIELEDFLQKLSSFIQSEKVNKPYPRSLSGFSSKGGRSRIGLFWEGKGY